MKIPISKPSLPPFESYTKSLRYIWKTHQLSNFAHYSQQLEESIAKYLNTSNIRLTSSADISLIIALATLRLEKGSEVIVSSFTFNSTVNAIVWNGLIPVFADISPQTLNISPESISKKITNKTKAILATNVFGNPCDYSAMKKLAKANSLKFITDSAGAYGSLYKGKKVGGLADIEIFSMSGTKIVSSAEGGFIVTRNKSLLKIIEKVRNYGISTNYNSKVLGINGKISEPNAALGCLTVLRIDKEIEKRRKIVARYKNLLSGIKHIKFQDVDKGNISNNAVFCILVSKRNELNARLNEKGIQTKIYFHPIHLMDYYKKKGISLPFTEAVWQKILCLPLYNDMKLREVDFVCKEIINFYNHA